MTTKKTVVRVVLSGPALHGRAQVDQLSGRASTISIHCRIGSVLSRPVG